MDLHSPAPGWAGTAGVPVSGDHDDSFQGRQKLFETIVWTEGPGRLCREFSPASPGTNVLGARYGHLSFH
jgi:hypothetical protein